MSNLLFSWVVVYHHVGIDTTEVYGPWASETEVDAWVASKQLEGWVGRFEIMQIEKP